MSDIGKFFTYGTLIAVQGGTIVFAREFAKGCNDQASCACMAAITSNPQRYQIHNGENGMSEQVKLEKSLSPLQVYALALGSIVGWGCFVLPGDMFLSQAGPVGTLLGFFVGPA